jgi:hypothetical protein
MADGSARSLIINSSLGVIVVLFLLANVSYFLVLPFDVVRHAALRSCRVVALTSSSAGDGNDHDRSRLWTGACWPGRWPALCNHRVDFGARCFEWNALHFLVSSRSGLQRSGAQSLTERATDD